MNDSQWAQHVARMAREMPYPETPDIARGVERRLAAKRRARWRLAWAGVVIAVAAGIVLAAVPEARASLARFLQIGGIRVLLIEPTATAGVEPPSTPFTLDDLSGESTLEAAEAAVGGEIPLPHYPPALGLPDRVFVQDIGGPLAVLAWTDSADRSEARLMLTVLAPGTVGTKGPPTVVQATTVNGREALWTEGPYVLSYGGLYQSERLVRGHALIWEADGFTYRLEGVDTLEEAVMIAESLAYRGESR